MITESFLLTLNDCLDPILIIYPFLVTNKLSPDWPLDPPLSPLGCWTLLSVSRLT